MTAIAIIVIILITIVGVVLFFFTSFGEGQSGSHTMNCQQKCSTIEVLAKTNGRDECGSGSNNDICKMSKVGQYAGNCSSVDCTVEVDGTSCNLLSAC